MKTEELKPCPFCGSEADVQNDYGRVFWTQCTNLECGSTDGTEHQSPVEAIANWNRRATPAGVTATDDALTDEEQAALDRLDKPEWRAASHLKLRAILAVEVARTIRMGAKIENLQDELSRAKSAPAGQELVAWVRRLSDGALTSEYLDEGQISLDQKNSGEWVPLFGAPAGQDDARYAAMDGDLSEDQQIELAEALVWEKVRQDILFIRQTAGLLCEGEFRNGMETALEELCARLGFTDAAMSTAPASEPVTETQQEVTGRELSLAVALVANRYADQPDGFAVSIGDVDERGEFSAVCSVPLRDFRAGTGTAPTMAEPEAALAKQSREGGV